MTNIDEFSVQNGRYLKEDSTTANIADLTQNLSDVLDALHALGVGDGIRTAILLGGGHRPAPDAHTLIHAGRLFKVARKITSLENEASLDIVVDPASGNYPHISALVTFGGSFDFRIYRGPTWTGGTEYTPKPKKWYSSLTFSGTVHWGVTVTDTGDANPEELFVPGGTGGQAIGNAGGSLEFEDVIDRPILYRITNVSGQSRDGSIALMMYNAGMIPDLGV